MKKKPKHKLMEEKLKTIPCLEEHNYILENHYQNAYRLYIVNINTKYYELLVEGQCEKVHGFIDGMIFMKNQYDNELRSLIKQMGELDKELNPQRKVE